jgi:iron complex outermembrane receptor protein
MFHKEHKYTARLLCGAAAGALVMFANIAHAEDLSSIDIASQPLAKALGEFASQTKRAVLVTPELTASRVSHSVSGATDPEAALLAMLDGTGLTYRRDGDTFLIVRASDPQSGSAAGDGAEGTVQALIVTAQKREEDIQDVPIAISAFTQEDLTRSQVAGGPDLMTQVPNFTFTKTNFSGYSIQIRGIGTQAISATTDPAVAVAFNNTPFIRNRFFEQEFYDLERVEVLRGPQGTLYGRNATAGVVNIISAKPKSHFEARLSADIADYNSTRLEGMLNLPLVEDKAALRIAGAWTKRDGYVKNRLTGQQTDGRDLWSTRVSLRLDPASWLDVNLIWEHFEENDGRLRTGKQLCHTDPGPSEVNGQPVEQDAAPIQSALTAMYVTQGCLPASLYSPDSFQTPNGFGLPYYGPLGLVGSPVYLGLNPYASTVQSRNLREIETHLTPEYTAKTDTAELQLKFDLPWNLSLSSETGYLKDFIFSFSDYNRFDTTPGVFTPGGAHHVSRPEDLTGPGPYPDVTDLNGTFCDPQLGCTNRLAAGDLSTARSTQFAQEFRLSSDWSGPFNFSLGANFLRYDTEEKYYVFINTITAFEAIWTNFSGAGPWVPGVSDNSQCLDPETFYGRPISSVTDYYSGIGCSYVDPNDIHHLNDQGRNYFLSKNPYHLLSYAAFGEVYYNFTPNLKLTAGLRWTDDKKTAPIIPSWLLAGTNRSRNGAGASYGTPTYKVIEQEWREPTGRLAVDWKPDLSFTDETLVYGSYVRGYKAGGANPPPPVLVLATVCPPECDPFGNPTTSTLTQHYLTHPETFKPEFVNAYEIGTKNTLLDGRLTANLSAFYYDYKGYQISEIVDRSAINFNYDATVKGAEVELDWRPVENLRLGFKGGYEDTRVANGMKAIDLIDRTAGKPGWMLLRPFPTLPSNCVIPVWLATVAWSEGVCAAYVLNVDPVTYLPYVPNPTVTATEPIPPGYPGYDPASANNGQGFEKDLSGHELPNAPKYTATITADYTIPLADNWLATLHADLYRQSEAWWRIFNDPGYDKLKAYNNVNLAAIFSNDDRGWQVMAYVKNVFNKDNITGAFLNSDDTGLTTNVFLNEPRLYGIRVTKNWENSWRGPSHAPGAPFPLTVELGAQGQRLDAPNQAIFPFDATFPKGMDPVHGQTQDLDWTHSPEVKITYQPSGSAWKLSADVRYGRTSNQTGRLRQEKVTGDAVCQWPTQPAYSPYVPGVDLSFAGKLRCDPTYGPITKTINGYEFTFQNKYNSRYLLAPTDRLSSSTDRLEEHTVADFAVGREVGLGMLGRGESSLGAGLRYAEFKSSTSGDMRAVPDMMLPDDFWAKYPTTFHQYIDSFDAKREFKGAGPTLSWDASRELFGADQSGHLDVDWTVTGGVLFGRQKTRVAATAGSTYFNGKYPSNPDQYVVNGLAAPTQTPITIAPRDKMATVPVLDLSLGLSYAVPGVKLSTGYRWERYFNVLDGGFEQHKAFDRTLDGPYVKFSIGFGG